MDKSLLFGILLNWFDIGSDKAANMISRYGLDVAIPLIVLSLAIIGAAFFIPLAPLRIVMLLVGVATLVFTLNFFRDPSRVTPEVAAAVFSPADGKVVSIGLVDAAEYLDGKAMQICIFMSPLNVHVNRYPVSGTVEYVRHIDGKFLMAWEDASSEQNERTLIGIHTGNYRMLFKQIAGFVARRIVCPVKEGDQAVAGERFGMIKFGSRVDVLLPEDAEVQVKLDEHVTAGESVIALVRR
jgi:phosphatidylserine decarboxylase